MTTNQADYTASPKDFHTNKTSGAAQRARLLKRLALGPITTIEARRELNIMMPAARIKELREAGHNIQTERVDTLDDQGRKHGRVAKYYLSAAVQEQRGAA